MYTVDLVVILDLVVIFLCPYFLIGVCCVWWVIIKVRPGCCATTLWEGEQWDWKVTVRENGLPNCSWWWVLHGALPLCMVHYRSAWCTTALHGALSLCMVHYRSVWCTTALRGALPLCVVHYRSAWCTTALRGALPLCVVHYRSTWCTTALHGALPHCMVHYRSTFTLCCGVQ